MFTVACCLLMVDKMRKFIVGTVPECIDKNTFLSGDCSFLSTKSHLVHIIVYSVCNPT